MVVFHHGIVDWSADFDACFKAFTLIGGVIIGFCCHNAFAVEMWLFVIRDDSRGVMVWDFWIFSIFDLGLGSSLIATLIIYQLISHEMMD